MAVKPSDFPCWSAFCHFTISNTDLFFLLKHFITSFSIVLSYISAHDQFHQFLIPGNHKEICFFAFATLMLSHRTWFFSQFLQIPPSNLPLLESFCAWNLYPLLSGLPSFHSSFGLLDASLPWIMGGWSWGRVGGNWNQEPCHPEMLAHPSKTIVWEIEYNGLRSSPPLQGQLSKQILQI